MRESEHEYVIMWNENDILDLIDVTAHEQYQLVLMLKGDPAADQIGNPMRAMVIDAVLDNKHNREIWRFSSKLEAEEICDEWEENRQSVMDEVREVGELIYDTYGRKVKC
jgi:hypothetical protein